MVDYKGRREQITEKNKKWDLWLEYLAFPFLWQLLKEQEKSEKDEQFQKMEENREEALEVEKAGKKKYNEQKRKEQAVF